MCPCEAECVIYICCVPRVLGLAMIITMVFRGVKSPSEMVTYSAAILGDTFDLAVPRWANQRIRSSVKVDMLSVTNEVSENKAMFVVHGSA